jgi:hypothetical protein
VTGVCSIGGPSLRRAVHHTASQTLLTVQHVFGHRYALLSHLPGLVTILVLNVLRGRICAVSKHNPAAAQAAAGQLQPLGSKQ